MKKRFVLLPVCILLLFLLPAGVFLWHRDYAEKEICSFASGDAVYNLSVRTVGEPQFPFGPGKCRLVLKKDGRKIQTLDLVLYNDGKWPDADNFRVVWEPGKVTVTASAEEQEDQVYTLYTDAVVP